MSDEVLTETVCRECGKNQEKETNFCPKCGEENPWMERNRYEFEEEDLPIVFEHTFSQADFQIWDSFVREFFDAEPGLKSSHIADFPGKKFPRMKKARVHVWYVVTEDYSLKGPFMSEEKAKKKR